MQILAHNQGNSSHIRPNTAQAIQTADPASGPSEPQDEYRPSFVPRERRSYFDAVKTGLIGAALVGVPASIGAAKSDLLGSGAATVTNLLAGPTVGAIAGGVGGWHLTPGKDQSGIFLTILTVPIGAAVGSVAYPLLSTIGSMGGWTGAAVGAAVAGIGLGAAEAAFVHKYNQGVEEHNRQGTQS